MEAFFPDFANGAVWISLLTLTFLEIVLGIDNIIFISIAAGKLPPDEQKKATNLGLLIAMGLRILLLLGISVLTAMSEPLSWASFGHEGDNFYARFTGQSLILIAGGIFLLYKSTSEIGHKVDGHTAATDGSMAGKAGKSLSSVIVQITVINLVFSIDSILTAVGMTNGMEGALFIMIFGVVASVIIMMLFAVPVGNFVNKHPSIQILGLAFLILIGFMLIAEGAHLGHLQVFGTEVGTVPKGYLYFAIAFSLLVEFLNMRMRKNKQEHVRLNSVTEEAAREGILDS